MKSNFIFAFILFNEFYFHYEQSTISDRSDLCELELRGKTKLPLLVAHT